MDLKLLKLQLRISKKFRNIWCSQKKENATETYAKLKDEYLSLKAILNVAGVTLTELDKIKE